jgi:hypothetical protein
LERGLFEVNPRRVTRQPSLRWPPAERKDTRLEVLENAEDGELVRFQEFVEIAWRDLIHAMETLLAALP